MEDFTEIIVPIPEGMEVDEKNSTFTKIRLKKKDTKPKSWRAYCEQQAAKEDKGFYINNYSSVCRFDWKKDMFTTTSYNYGDVKNVLPFRDLADKFLAYMQLISLRQAWIGDWVPDWSKENVHKTAKYCIISTVEGIEVHPYYNRWIPPLSFPTEEMAKEFIDTFKDLPLQAKGLY